ncbi:MAG: hypothetical protein WBA74_14970 [Cyclobacteriaceae bacterium]
MNAKKVILLFLIVSGTLLSCDNEINTTQPSCLQAEIDSLDTSGICDDSTVESYYFNSNIVYVFNLMNCVDDGGSEVVDGKCNSLGFLGGFAGKSNISGKDFYKNAQFIDVVWRKQ